MANLFQRIGSWFTEDEEEKKRRQKFQASVGRLFGKAKEEVTSRITTPLPEQFKAAGELTLPFRREVSRRAKEEAEETEKYRMPKIKKVAGNITDKLLLPSFPLPQQKKLRQMVGEVGADILGANVTSNLRGVEFLSTPEKYRQEASKGKLNAIFAALDVAGLVPVLPMGKLKTIGGPQIEAIAKLKSVKAITAELSKIKGLNIVAEDLATLAKKLVKPKTAKAVSSIINDFVTKSEGVAELGITSFRGKAVKTVEETAPYFDTPRAKGFVNSLTNKAKDFGVKLNSIERAAGTWEGEIEPSFATKVTGTLKNVRAYAAYHGRAHIKDAQNVVAIFKRAVNGKGTKYEFAGIADPNAAVQLLNKFGISGSTFNPITNTIAVWDNDGSLLKSVINYGKELGINPQVTKGYVEFIEKGSYKAILDTFAREGGGVRSSILPQLGEAAAKTIGAAPEAIKPPGVTPPGAIPTPPDQVITAFSQIKEAIKKAQDFDPKTLESIVTSSEKTNLAVANMFRSGLLKIDQIPEFAKYGETFDAEDAARFIEQFATFGGRDLNRISQWQKQIDNLLPADVLAKIKTATPGWTDLVFNKIPVSFINTWRALLVSQLATAMRNLDVAGGMMFPARALEDAMVGATKMVTKKLPPKEAFAPVMEDFFSLANAVRPGKRNLIGKVLEANPFIKGKLYATPVMDVAVTDKVAKVATIFNRTQEFMARHTFFEATLRGKLGELGLKLENISPDKIPTKVLKESVDEALRMTFAANPSGTFFKEAVRLSNKMPWAILNTVLYPFPRFMSNSIKTIFQYSPGGFLQFVNPKYAKLLAKGDDQAMRLMARALIGTSAFVGAAFLRNSKFAGEKWYEIKIGDKTIDTRPFGPLLPTYMFVAEFLKGNKSFGPKDWIEGMLGVNRIAGTSLFITSLVTGETDWKNFRKSLEAWAGTFVGGFATPATTVKDILGQFIQGERISRFVKETPIAGPFLEKLPFVRELLPEVPSITRAEPFERESTLLRQLTGLSVSTKNLMEREMDRLQIKVSDALPRTGEPFIDRLITQETGPIIERAMEKIKSPQYQMLSDTEKEEAIRNLFSDVKKAAKEKVIQEHKYEIAARFYEELLKAKDKEARDKTWTSWINKLGNNFMDQIKDPIVSAKEQNLSPEELYKRLRGAGGQTPLEVGGFRVP